MAETTITMKAQKRIALIAHDNLKDDIVRWAVRNQEKLSKHILCGTGTTARLIATATGLQVQAFMSGPLGGDQQVGSRIAEGDIDMVVFFCDPLEAQPHDPDIKALLRIAAVYDIPIANNRATADFLLTSKFMNGEYTHTISDFKKMTERRVELIYNEMISEE